MKKLKKVLRPLYPGSKIMTMAFEVSNLGMRKHDMKPGETREFKSEGYSITYCGRGDGKNKKK